MSTHSDRCCNRPCIYEDDGEAAPTLEQERVRKSYGKPQAGERGVMRIKRAEGCKEGGGAMPEPTGALEASRKRRLAWGSAMDLMRQRQVNVFGRGLARTEAWKCESAQQLGRRVEAVDG